MEGEADCHRVQQGCPDCDGDHGCKTSLRTTPHRQAELGDDHRDFAARDHTRADARQQTLHGLCPPRSDDSWDTARRWEPLVALGIAAVWGIYGAIYFVSSSRKRGRTTLLNPRGAATA
jgi:hypothetical protein